MKQRFCIPFHVGWLFFNKVSMMFIIYFHASKNGTNLPDVKTYCNKVEQIFATNCCLTGKLQERLKVKMEDFKSNVPVRSP